MREKEIPERINELRILILANDDIGLYKFRKELIRELISRGNEVYVSLPRGFMIEKIEGLGCTFVETPIDRRGINPFTDLKLLAQYIRIIRRIKPDYIITYTIKPNIYGGIAASLLNTAYSENITGLGTSFQSKGLLKTVVVTLYKTALRKAKVVFFENQAICDEMVSLSICQENKTCVLPGAGVNLEEFQYAKYPNNEVFHFLFIGRVMKEKGIDELFAAMKRLVVEGSNCVLDVAGYYEEDYEKTIEEYKKAGWLNYYGFLEDVRPLIAQCDCFVLPSWHEGMANTNLECAAMGRPVITSNIPGCKEAVVDGESGYLCEPKNVESLYSCMKQMMARSDREEMGKAGRKHMEDVFDKKRVVHLTAFNFCNKDQ